MSREIKNAVIKDVFIGIEDHGLLTMWIYLDFGGSSQGFGGYDLYGDWKWRNLNHSEYRPYAGRFISECLFTLRVSDVSKLRGLAVRADGDSGKIYGIGHIVEDRWFYPAKDFDNSESEALR